METTDELARRIRDRGLPEAVVSLALHGGAAVHPALELHADHIELTGDDPTSAVLNATGRQDMLPLWMTGATTTVFSRGDGTIELWSAEDETGPWERWSDFGAAVRALLTDLWEFEVDEAQRREVAEFLVPKEELDAVLEPEER
ncbi:hypothetical protein GCM10027417_23060 [Glutamicibacter endophyticus]